MIEKITIPDDDMVGWIKVLHEGGFSDEEIDSILSHLNSTYAGLKKEEFINEELNKMDGEIKNRRGIGLSESEREKLKAGIKSRLS